MSLSVRYRVRMRARLIDEPHRASSPLELLFDLTFVVAIAALTLELAHNVASGHGADAVIPFLQVFFAIWWAWMNFTWFASSYDTDDIPYRLATMVQMAGVLVLAAGVPAAAGHADYRAVTTGYLIMRLGLTAQWIRAGIEDPAARPTAFRYAIGIMVLQVGWFLRIAFVDGIGVVSFLVLVVLELAVPWWAERGRTKTNWHPHHIAERYGLLVIIVLGESVLAATRAVQQAVETLHLTVSLVTVALSGLVLLFSVWWLYFLHPAGDGLADRRHRSYHWGYGHYGIFVALAALGAGLEVSVEQTSHHIEASPTAVGYAVAIPVSVFLVLLHAVQTAISPDRITRRTALTACVVAVLLTAITFASPVTAK